MRTRRMFLGGLLLLVADAGVAVAQERPCVRPPARTVAPGATVNVTVPARIPCQLAAVETAIELRADAAGRIPGISQNIARSPDGRFFSVWESEIFVWSPEGRFLRSFGRKGGGPGEFRLPPQVSVGADGRVHAREYDRWTVFSPGLELLGTRPLGESELGGPTTRIDDDGATLLDDGTFLSADYSAHKAGWYFVVWEVAPRGQPVPSGPPRVVRQFDPIPSAESQPVLGLAPSSRYRPIAYAGGETFWAGPPAFIGTRGYELELWRTDGTKLRTLRREAAWFPRRTAVAADGPPAPAIGGLFLDASGLLYVFVSAPNEHWRPTPPPHSGPPPRFDPANRPPNPFDLYVDVIDVASATVVASAGPMDRRDLVARLPVPVFRGTSLAVRLGESADGLSTARIVEWRPVAR